MRVRVSMPSSQARAAPFQRRGNWCSKSGSTRWIRDWNTALDELDVTSFLVKTIPGTLRYDRNRITVAAGREISLVFDNNDLMPHNLVLVAPGAEEEVGESADLMAAQADGLARGYVPDSKHVLHATRLLQPGQSQKLSITAPARPGEYPYLCTFPGHWRSMRGPLVVTVPGK